MRQLPAARRPGPGPGGAVGLLTVSVSAWPGYTLVRLGGEGDVTVRGRLRSTAGSTSFDEIHADRLVALQSDATGAYLVTADVTDEPSDQRLVAFLDTLALLRRS